MGHQDTPGLTLPGRQLRPAFRILQQFRTGGGSHAGKSRVITEALKALRRRQSFERFHGLFHLLALLRRQAAQSLPPLGRSEFEEVVKLLGKLPRRDITRCPGVFLHVGKVMNGFFICQKFLLQLSRQNIPLRQS